MGSVKDEIKQTRPFASPADEAVVTLLRTADKLRTTLSAVVDPHGITLQQYNVLRILRGAGEAGLPTLEIAARMIEHNPGITRLLDRLEAKKLVRRERCPEDRRQVLCHATALALRTLAAIDGPLEQAGGRALAALERPRVNELVRLLDAIRTRASSTNPEEKTENTRKKKEKRA
jgi:DNA-binding MarR family transcriptional regulator